MEVCSPSLAGFASELALQIFEMLPDCHAVTALNRASHYFYAIWLFNAAAIPDAVLSRTIKCSVSAEGLVRFQTAQEREWVAVMLTRQS